MADLRWESRAALERGIATPGFKAVAADLANFATGGVTVLIGGKTHQQLWASRSSRRGRAGTPPRAAARSPPGGTPGGGSPTRGWGGPSGGRGARGWGGG